MCINKSGMCTFCGERYTGATAIPAICANTLCASKSDLVATLYHDGGIENEDFFVYKFDENDYLAALPESLSNLSLGFPDHASCKRYIDHLVMGVCEWQQFVTIPVNGRNELKQDFLHFKQGDNCSAVWMYFENTYNVSVLDDLKPFQYGPVLLVNEPVPCLAVSH